jgi:protein TonB
MAREWSVLQNLCRWLGAVAAVMVLHAALAWAMLAREPLDAPPTDPPPAVMIELVSLAVPMEAAPDDLAPGPQMTESASAPAPDSEAVDAVEEAPKVPDDEILKPLPDDPVPIEENMIEATEETTTVKAQELPQETREPPKKQKASKAAPAPAPRTSAPPKAQVKKSNRSAAPAAGASSSPSISPAKWRGALMAHLNRHKRSPRGGGAGTATVKFTINRSGSVTSVRLARSSGSKALDAAAISLVRRASPVPRPPASVRGNSIALSVPVRFR